MNAKNMNTTRLVRCPCFWLVILLISYMFWVWESTLASIKTLGYATIVSFFVFLNIPQEQIGILAILMLIDWITGVGKQLRVDKTNVTSYRMGLGVMKKAWVILLLMSGGLVIKSFKLDPWVYVETALSILIMSEFYSIIQNVYAIRTWVILPEYDAISVTLKKLASFIEGTIERLTTFQKK